MDWNQVCADPALKDLSYKIELNEWDQIVMSPASIRHVLLQDRIAGLLRALVTGGRVLQEFPDLEAGAQEVWICGEDGVLEFHDRSGVLPNSRIAPRFPNRIALD